MAQAAKKLSSESEATVTTADAARDCLGHDVERHIARYFEMHEGKLPPTGLYDRIIQVVERPLIETTLKATGGNQLKAAEILGINRNTLRKKMRELGLEAERTTK